ncbi:winged helix-turn-helix domain-containing tetratricopeptide repeat protein [Roseomonas sp. CCTCC AB2023176]|uniref:winged helix-turn-helix domain-containing tetratricopeptide repeat protein n=1 Tax=Roseomonas sp. CCTCC AB2023176 TaxID=3342640 RepID=UPI0035DA7AC9
MRLSPASRKLRFGDCTFDEGLGVLVAPDGSETLLRPKTFDLLRLLLDNAGRVVERATILDTVWPGIFVTDDSITQCIGELRRALGPAAELLRTVPRRGYLLQAEVLDERAPAVQVADPDHGLSFSTSADDRPVIAVLPFRKEYFDREEAYFADGIIEGIVEVLSRLDWLLVISRGSALAFAEVTTDARAAARDLGARYVLYGGLRRSGGRLRITTELTDAERGTVIRSDRFEGSEADLFELQDRVAEQVMTLIAPRLQERELSRVLRKPPASLTAYDFVLRALNEIRRLDRASMDRARTLLEGAIAADPTSAMPHSYMAWWHSLRVAQGWSDAGDFALSARFADAALDRDPRDPFSLALRGFLRGYMDHDFEAAREMLDEAVASGPSCAMAWSWGAALRSWLDEGAEAITWAERGLRLAPMDSFTFLHEHILAQACYTAGEFERAAACARRSAAANALHAPNLRTLVATLVALGRAEEARELADRVRVMDPEFRLSGFVAKTPLRGEIRDLFARRLSEAGLPW